MIIGDTVYFRSWENEKGFFVSKGTITKEWKNPRGQVFYSILDGNGDTREFYDWGLFITEEAANESLIEKVAV